jgi:hypothetical protein
LSSVEDDVKGIEELCLKMQARLTETTSQSGVLIKKAELLFQAKYVLTKEMMDGNRWDRGRTEEKEGQG